MKRTDNAMDRGGQNIGDRHNTGHLLQLLFVVLFSVLFIAGVIAGKASRTYASADPSDPQTSASDGASFQVYYLDVGQGDSELITCNGHAALIDGGTAEHSSKLYSVLKKLALDHLDYIVCTHAHADHAGGLPGAMTYATVGTALASHAQDGDAAFNRFLKALSKQNVAVTVPNVGDTFSLGDASFTVVGPTDLIPDEENNNSLVLKVTYGETSFLFTGDAEQDEEQLLLYNNSDILKSTVLKVAHHGGASSAFYAFIAAVDPTYAVIEVGAGNTYGHPTAEILNLLKENNTKTFRTDLQGDVVCTSDGRNVSFNPSKNSDADVFKPGAVESPAETSAENKGNTACDYVLNTNSKKFHFPSCSSVSDMLEGNKQYYTGTRDNLISMGYQPCGRCKP